MKTLQIIRPQISISATPLPSKFPLDSYGAKFTLSGPDTEEELKHLKTTGDDMPIDEVIIELDGLANELYSDIVDFIQQVRELYYGKIFLISNDIQLLNKLSTKEDERYSSWDNLISRRYFV